jgi:hypothetical protein
MGVVQVDWDSMESNSFEALEPGEYSGKIEKIEEKGPGGSGYKYLDVQILLEEQNQRCWTKYSFSPKALWKMKEDFEKLGLDVSSGEFDTDELLGREVIVTLGLRDHWKGETDADGNVKKENEVTCIEPGGF